jgi:hypothetical protein
VPRKELWIEQHTTDLGAWYAVAEVLGRSVKELKSTMDYREFVGWVVYLNDRADDAKHGR